MSLTYLQEPVSHASPTHLLHKPLLAQDWSRIFKRWQLTQFAPKTSHPTNHTKWDHHSIIILVLSPFDYSLIKAKHHLALPWFPNAFTSPVDHTHPSKEKVSSLIHNLLLSLANWPLTSQLYYKHSPIYVK